MVVLPGAHACLAGVLAEGVGQEIADELSKRIMILDGAMGTMLQRRRLEEEDFRGAFI